MSRKKHQTRKDQSDELVLLSVVQSGSAARRKQPHDPVCRIQQNFARQRLDVRHRYPSPFFPRVVLLIEGAPWHRGVLI